MKIPKSIFEDPPPVVESLVFRPATPPPAYTPTGKDGTGKATATVPIDQNGNGLKLDNEEVPDTSFPIPAQTQTTLKDERRRNSPDADSLADELQLNSTNVTRTTP